MAKQIAPVLYTEARLNLDQSYSGSTIELTLPASNPSSFSVQKPPPRAILPDVQVGLDESAFTKHHLASEASIYFRKHHGFPRCFLWRLLDNRKSLAIQAVDLTGDDGAKAQPQLTLLLKFPVAVSPFGVAFSDPPEKDALSVFALTTSDLLYTITLHREYFAVEKATEAPANDWCRVYAPAALKVQRPFRLTAVSSQLLFISLAGDSLLRLARKTAEDGSSWQEAYYTGTTALQSISRSLRLNLTSKIAWQSSPPSVKFGDQELGGSVIASIALSPDENYIFALCLDETLRVWHANNGRIVAEADVSGGNNQDPNSAKRLIPATQKQVMKVVDCAGDNNDEYYLVTFSPETRKFRFWGMMDNEVAQDTFREIHQEIEFLPPIDMLLDTSIWNLEEFHVIPGRHWKETRIWIRVVSGTISRVFTLTFNLFDETEELRTVWRSQWHAVSAGYQSVDALNLEAPAYLNGEMASSFPISSTERWLDFLLYPGRFSVPTLETALTVFVSGKRLEHISQGPLKERLSKAVAANVTASQRNASDSKIGQYEAAMSKSWQELFVLVKDLHRRRCEPLSLEFDPTEQQPWLVSADTVSPIRVCSELEICDLNRKRLQHGQRTLWILSGSVRSTQAEALLNVAHVFRTTVSSSLVYSFEQMLIAEVLEPPSEALSDRIQALNEGSQMSDGITDDDFARMKDAMDEYGGYELLSGAAFHEVFEALKEEEKGGQVDAEALTAFGAKSVVRVASETVALNLTVLVNLALLVVFVATEIDPEELSAEMDETFDGLSYFSRILQFVKANYAFQFLLSRVRREERRKKRRTSIATDSPTFVRLPESGAAGDRAYSSTLLESVFLGGFWATLKEPPKMQLPHALTYWARRWLSSLDSGDQMDDFTTHVLADMIHHQDYAYASEFMPFVEDAPWGTYVKGRLYLATGEYDRAAARFKKGAYSLSATLFDVSSWDTAELVNLTERDDFSHGLCRYYCHVLHIFDRQMAHTHVAEFSTLALQSFNLQLHSDTADDLGNADVLKAELLSRSFTALLRTSRFRDAYSALSQMTNATLKRASLSNFLSTLIQQKHVELVISFPYANFAAGEVDSTLESLARKTLSLHAVRYFAVLYAYRMSRGNVRGAAQAAFERLRRIKNSGEAARDPQYPRVAEAYLVLINALACLGEDQAWISVEPTINDAFNQAVIATQLGKGRHAVQKPKRGVLTLEDIRRLYQAELDRIADAERGRFPFAVNETDGENGDEMDVL